MPADKHTNEHLWHIHSVFNDPMGDSSDPRGEPQEVPPPQMMDEDIPGHQEREEAMVREWRLNEFQRMGFSPEAAMELAMGKLDLNEFRRVIDKGATPEQAQQIVSRQAKWHISMGALCPHCSKPMVGNDCPSCGNTEQMQATDMNYKSPGSGLSPNPDMLPPGNPVSAKWHYAFQDTTFPQTTQQPSGVGTPPPNPEEDPNFLQMEDVGEMSYDQEAAYQKLVDFAVDELNKGVPEFEILATLIHDLGPELSHVAQTVLERAKQQPLNNDGNLQNQPQEQPPLGENQDAMVNNSTSSGAGDTVSQPPAFQAKVKHGSIPMNPGLKYYSPDEVGETLAGISKNTYGRLWELVSQQEQAGTAAPIGGDRHDPYGEHGTPMVEDPQSRMDIMSGGQGNMESVWDQLTPEEQQEINAAYEREQAQMAKYDQEGFGMQGRVKGTNITGKIEAQWVDLYGQEVSRIRTAAGVQDILTEDVEPMNQIETDPVNIINELINSVEPPEEKTKASLHAHIEHLKDTSRLCRQALYGNGTSEQMERIAKIEASTQLAILNFTDELQRLKPSLDDYLASQPTYRHDGYGLEEMLTTETTAHVNTSAYDRLMDEHPKLVVHDLSPEERLDALTVRRAASDYISQYIWELPPKLRTSMAEEFTEATLAEARKAKPEPQQKTASVEEPIENFDGPASALFI